MNLAGSFQVISYHLRRLPPEQRSEAEAALDRIDKQVREVERERDANAYAHDGLAKLYSEAEARLRDFEKDGHSEARLQPGPISTPRQGGRT